MVVSRKASNHFLFSGGMYGSNKTDQSRIDKRIER